VTPRSVAVGYKRYRRQCCLQLQVAWSSETLVSTTTLRGVTTQRPRLEFTTLTLRKERPGGTSDRYRTMELKFRAVLYNEQFNVYCTFQSFPLDIVYGLINLHYGDFRE
jgi:hypothetical protein